MSCIVWILALVLTAIAALTLIRWVMKKGYRRELYTTMGNHGIASTWFRPNGDFRGVSTVFKGDVFETVVFKTPMHFRSIGFRHALNPAEATKNHVEAICAFLTTDTRKSEFNQVLSQRLNQQEISDLSLQAWELELLNQLLAIHGLPQAEAR